MDLEQLQDRLNEVEAVITESPDVLRQLNDEKDEICRQLRLLTEKVSK